MSSEGVALLSKGALVVALIVVASFFRAVIGPGRRRDHLLFAGTLGGMSLGIAVNYLILPWTKGDASVMCASAGMMLGWGAAWLIARKLPLERR